MNAMKKHCTFVIEMMAIKVITVCYFFRKVVEKIGEAQ
jgi:hypothetical protein